MLSDGTAFTEKPDIAERRAKKVALALKDTGVPATNLEIRWKTEPEASNGVDDFKRRRVTVTVQP